jgi:hypothetical protein
MHDSGDESSNGSSYHTYKKKKNGSEHRLQKKLSNIMDGDENQGPKERQKTPVVTVSLAEQAIPTQTVYKPVLKTNGLSLSSSKPAFKPKRTTPYPAEKVTSDIDSSSLLPSSPIPNESAIIDSGQKTNISVYSDDFE